MSTPATDPLLSRTIAGKYQITTFIGEGAMGSVYRARHLTLDTSVAIKVLKEHSRADSFAERFSREARAASRLDHPNSVRVIDYGEEPDGLLYLVMELLDGRELAAVIYDEFPLAPQRIVGILGQALAAIAVAHDQGIIHRDLKPENIMLLRRSDDEGTERDLVKVCDFGIAKLQHAEPVAGRRLTTRGEVIGTPEFMSPEQARGEELDARSDLYSMGVILFEMLTGRAPFQSDTALGLALMHVTDPPPPPSLLHPGVNVTLERVCLRAMSKRREDRYQTAREMRLDLRSALGSTSVQTGPQQTLQLANRTPARHAETITTTVVASNHDPLRDEHASPPRTRRKRGLVLGALLLLGASGIFFLSLPRGAVKAPAAPPPLSAAPVATIATVASVSELTSASAVVAPEVAPVAMPGPLPIRTVTTKPVNAPSVTKPVVVATPEPEASAPLVVAAPAPEVKSAAVLGQTPPTPPPAVVTVSPFDPSGGHAVIGSATATNGVSGASVRASLNTEAISRCYRDALKAKGAPASGSATMQLSIDDGGRVASASLKGAEFLPGMKGCVEGVARLARVKGVDTGDASATVSLSFMAK